jgi:hypothetical protein
MAVLFLADFEAGPDGATILTDGSNTAYDGNTRGSGATATFSSTQKASGSLSALLTTPATARSNFLLDTFAAPLTTLYRRFYVYPTTTPGATVPILRIATGTTIHAQISCDSTRKLGLYRQTTLISTMRSSRCAQATRARRYATGSAA